MTSPAITAGERALRARIASAVRYGDADTERDARRAFALSRVEARIRAAVESAPPLPTDVQARLVELIRTASPPPDEAAVA